MPGLGCVRQSRSLLTGSLWAGQQKARCLPASLRLSGKGVSMSPFIYREVCTADEKTSNQPVPSKHF